MTAEERKFRRTTERFGGPIVSSPSLDVARQRVRETAESRAFAKALADLKALIDMDELATVSVDGIAGLAAPLLGRVASRALQEGVRIELAVLASQVNLLLGVGRDAWRQAAEAQAEDPLAFVYNPEIPLTVIEAMLGTFTAQAAMFGLLHALFPGSKVRPQLAKYLAETYRDGMRGYLRVLASIPQASVPPSIVPLEDRYDINALKRRHDDFWQAVEEGKLDFGAPDDDE